MGHDERAELVLVEAGVPQQPQPAEQPRGEGDAEEDRDGKADERRKHEGGAHDAVGGADEVERLDQLEDEVAALLSASEVGLARDGSPPRAACFRASCGPAGERYAGREMPSRRSSVSRSADPRARCRRADGSARPSRRFTVPVLRRASRSAARSSLTCTGMPCATVHEEVAELRLAAGHDARAEVDAVLAQLRLQGREQGQCGRGKRDDRGEDERAEQLRPQPDPDWPAARRGLAIPRQSGNPPRGR